MMMMMTMMMMLMMMMMMMMMMMTKDPGCFGRCVMFGCCWFWCQACLQGKRRQLLCPMLFNGDWQHNACPVSLAGGAVLT
jgi:hypothetical protein